MKGDAVKIRVLRILVPPLELILRLGESRYGLFRRVLIGAPPRLLALLGEWRAVHVADAARRRVPAYRRFTQERGVTDRDVARLRLPLTDKPGYVDRFGLLDRCVDGCLPAAGVAIDESSGSSGTPYNWIRSQRERETVEICVSHFTRYLYGDGVMVTINAFSMGAWATGTSMGIALQRNGIVKNTGPDPEKILATLAFLGTGYRYLVCGYPPFLKHLMDVAGERGFPLADYDLAAAVGGEGMSEELRDYLSTIFVPVYSGYGATDVELGLAGETPLTVGLRRAAWADRVVRRALFGDDPRLPMLFQYNPLSHHVTVTDGGELVFTVARSGVLCPRIAYNIHDEGGVATYAEMRERLTAAGLEFDSFASGGARVPRLPFLWVYGRKDSTVSVMGANIYPEDIEQSLYRSSELAAMTSSFCLGLEEQAAGTVRPCISFEVREPITAGLVERFAGDIVAELASINADFRVALGENREGVLPVVRLYAGGEGPFRRDRGRIKQTRLVSLAAV
jgi:phenylacetate-CoA ligase